MATADQPRFQLLDNQELQDLIDSADSKNTKNVVKYSMKIFEEYLRVINTDLDSVHTLSNVDLDELLQKFYVGARQQNGSLYSKKSMLSIRFGLQRHFLNFKNVDILNHSDFANSSRVFKCFSATLKQKGKGVVKHKEAITPEDMMTIQDSFDLNDPQGLQDKVFIDVMLFFCNRGRENLREMTRDSFEIGEENGKTYITLKDTLTKNNRENEFEKSQGGIMTETGGQRCPVASFQRYMDKLNPDCQWFWQKPKPKAKLHRSESDTSPWYCNAPLGKNTIGDKMKTISSRAGTRPYTNHCLRATSITSLQNAGFRDRDIMSVSGHHSESSLKHYATTSRSTKQLMSSAISRTLTSSSRPNLPATQREMTTATSTTTTLQSEVAVDIDLVGLGPNTSPGPSKSVAVPVPPSFNIENCVVNIYTNN